MNDFESYYEALNKLALVVIPEGAISLKDKSAQSQFLEDLKKPQNEMNLWDDSYILAAVGHRGSGKTTLAASLAIYAKWLWPEIRIISNFPIKWGIKNERGKLTVNQAEPLDLVKMVNFDADYQHALIILDECPSILNRMNASTNKNKILNLWIQQLRKNHNNLILCSQDFKLIDYEAQYQVDIIAYCKDAYRRYPSSGVKRGGVILLDLIDNSGQWTGYTYKEKPRVHRRRVCSEYIWGTFDTYFQLDIIAQLWRLEIQREKVTVGHNENGGKNGEYVLKTDALLRSLIDLGIGEISTKEAYAVAGATNKAQRDDIGHRLKLCGISSKRLPGEKDFYYSGLEKYKSETFIQGGGE